MFSRTDRTPGLQEAGGERWWGASARVGGVVDGPLRSGKVGTLIEQREKMQIFEKPVKGGLIQSNQLNRKT